jgi:hypothetical protein
VLAAGRAGRRAVLSATMAAIGTTATRGHVRRRRHETDAVDPTLPWAISFAAMQRLLAACAHSRKNFARQFVGRISVSVIRPFVENPPCTVGLVGGAIRFAIVPPGFCANDGAFKPCASQARAMSLCASPGNTSREGTHGLPTEVETGKADASTSKKCRMDCCFRRSMCSLGL